MAENTLRDTISGLVDQAENGQTIELPTAEPTTSPEPSVTVPTEGSETPSAGRTANRLRDESGRLLPGTKPVEPVVATEPAVPRPQRPSSWKKEHWDDWEKLDPKVASYIHQRESEYAKGVSTYKQEFDQAKPLLDAIAPHRELIQQHGIDPGKQIDKYFQIHKSLALGTDDQKLAVFKQLAEDYKIPVQNLFTQQNGQLYYNPQVQAYQPPQPQVDVTKIVEQKIAERESTQALQNFMNAKDSAGNPAYPHFDRVRGSMAQLLEAGKATDLEHAYKLSVRLEDDLWQEEQDAQRQAAEQARLKSQQAVVQKAKSNAVSVKTSSPVAPVSGKKGLRATLEDAYDQHVEGRL